MGTHVMLEAKLSNWREIREKLEKAKAAKEQDSTNSLPKKSAGLGSPKTDETEGREFRTQPMQMPFEYIESIDDYEPIFDRINQLNTEIYSTLIPTRSWAEIDERYNECIRFDVGAQTTNLMSNYGIALYLQGKVDEAVSQFKKALARTDRFAEAEASWFMNLILLAKGNVAEARVYEEKCRKSGGYDKPSFLAEGYNIESDTPHFIQVSGNLRDSSLNSFLEFMEDGNNIFRTFFAGFTAINNSMLAISGSQLPTCATCIDRTSTYLGESPVDANGIPMERWMVPEQGPKLEAPQYHCEHCGRNESNTVVIRPSMGPVIAATHDLYFEGSCVGMVVVTDSNYAQEIINDYVLKPSATNSNFESDLNDYFFEYLKQQPFNLRAYKVGEFISQFESRWSNESNPFSSIFFSQLGQGIDSVRTVNYGKNTRPGTFEVFIYSADEGGLPATPSLILILRKQVSESINFRYQELDLEQWKATFQKWYERISFISEEEILHLQAINWNVMTYQKMSESTQLGPAWKNDYAWIATSWHLLHAVINERLKVTPNLTISRVQSDLNFDEQTMRRLFATRGIPNLANRLFGA